MRLTDTNGVTVDVSEAKAAKLLGSSRRWSETAGVPGPVPDASGFDPSRHTVAEVNDYLASADQTEQERVLALEADGKSRSGVTV